MQTILNFLIWSPDPDIFTIPFIDRPVRWYGLLFAGGFIISQQILFRMFKKEGRPEKDVEKLTVYMVVATIVGARLGHCLFYAPQYYLTNPLEILKVWEGGLASHGGAIGILIAIWLFVRKYKDYSFLWLLDRLVIVVALTGAMIRTGNFLNSEMEGIRNYSDYGVVYAAFTEEMLTYNITEVDEVTFQKGGEMVSTAAGKEPITVFLKYKPGYDLTLEDKAYLENQIYRALTSYKEITQHIDFGGNRPLAYKTYQEGDQHIVEIYGQGIVRHAAQLYEAIYCLLLFGLLLWLWYSRRDRLPEGFLFALFMILLWSLRFVDEFFKMNQEAFEDNLPLNMGQWLSIPLVLVGIILLVFVLRKQNKTTEEAEP